MGSLPWYKEGLRFKCTECGKCCTGAPGVVWISEEEIETIARKQNTPVNLFKRTHIRLVDNRYALIEKKTSNGDYDCIFLKDKKCQVYADRPQQCRTYPWWQHNLNTEESWRLAALECEGITEEAPIVPYAHIKSVLEQS